MSVSLEEIEIYCNKLLSSDSFKDYCPNGLQVAGANKISKIVTGVTACQQLLDSAVSVGADLILTHHGYFWRGEDQRVVSIKKNRLKTLLVNDISLLAYHLPLDAHAIYGNNVQLAKLMGWQVTSGMDAPIGESIVLLGELQQAMSAAELACQIGQKLNREPLYIEGHNRPIKKIAFCTGAAQSYIEQVASFGVDAFISGEISEQTVHLARELGINYFAAGHHATESFGVQALGEHLAEKYDLEHQFIDVPNPV
ncbi:MAG: Nif3-like dinuclear metal center hexameric protein [Oceanospirillaceae bacterium]|nr:Nif3-like dinuclear metal center hexameric protein [Oceanospirillaceae bacterium]